VRTVGLDEVTTRKLVAADYLPEPPEAPPLGARRSRAPLALLGAVGLLCLACGGACAALSCAGLLPIL
jgi:hypothetical protein